MYDSIVVGAGHAGCEAAYALKKMNKKVLLVTSDFNNIATLPCNPSIGGPAKGILVREIDALGGLMGKVADKTLTQMRMLNVSKGPAVRALRAQVDKDKYPQLMRETLIEKGIEIKECTIEDLIITDNVIGGVILEDGTEIKSKTVVITAGTYLESLIMVGSDKKLEGADGNKTPQRLHNTIRKYHTTVRLKTGTPARIKRESIDFSKTEVHNGDDVIRGFSHQEYIVEKDNQIPSYLTYTQTVTHDIINNNLHKSSMYSGNVKGVGPRYCPSIEDKVIRFSDKDRHQVFLEQEYDDKDIIYVQGFSTSMELDIQDQMLRTIIGLENVEVYKYGYAIEYDAIDSLEVYPTLESKIVKNLYFAGQVNGTSGYEEAASQGLVAGVNVALKIDNKDPFILRRDEAYIGVLIDDLVTKGTKEPYRMLTSRAEYRLLLRHDNADYRLFPHAHEYNLISESDYSNFTSKASKVEEVIALLLESYITPNTETKSILESNNSTNIKNRITLHELLKRPEISMDTVLKFIDIDESREVLEQVEIQVKYEGYIKKAVKQAEKQESLDKLKLPDNIDYNKITNLALEAKEKLSLVKPKTIGQASRISGVNPADISILLIYLKNKEEK